MVKFSFWILYLTQAQMERKEQRMAVLTEPWPYPDSGSSDSVHSYMSVKNERRQATVQNTGHQSSDIMIINYALPENEKSARTKCFLDLTLDIWSKKNSPTRNPGNSFCTSNISDESDADLWMPGRRWQQQHWETDKQCLNIRMFLMIADIIRVHLNHWWYNTLCLFLCWAANLHYWS